MNTLNNSEFQGKMLFHQGKRICENIIGIDQFKRRGLKVFSERRYLFQLAEYIMFI